ncbi:hypothetical protein DH09_08120 [Bacillaceae bacterium JMAK1]|nr:hypothetical protein DH09_08120 [Bacillaceae bacterium JMAK1]
MASHFGNDTTVGGKKIATLPDLIDHSNNLDVHLTDEFIFGAFPSYLSQEKINELVSNIELFEQYFSYGDANLMFLNSEKVLNAMIEFEAIDGLLELVLESQDPSVAESTIANEPLLNMILNNTIYLDKAFSKANYRHAIWNNGDAVDKIRNNDRVISYLENNHLTSMQTANGNANYNWTRFNNNIQRYLVLKYTVGGNSSNRRLLRTKHAGSESEFAGSAADFGGGNNIDVRHVLSYSNLEFMSESGGTAQSTIHFVNMD